jgi:urease accessory protein
MLTLNELVPPGISSDDELTLPFESRQKSRLHAVTDKGREVGLFMPRGMTLRSGMLLRGDDEIYVLVKAALEPVSVMRSNESLQFAKACYHLGNRHVKLQILDGELRYLQDHVLDAMLKNMGLFITHEMLPFEPEAGAYHSHEH